MSSVLEFTNNFATLCTDKPNFGTWNISFLRVLDDLQNPTKNKQEACDTLCTLLVGYLA